MTWAIFDDVHMQAIGEVIASGSERVTAVVGGALLDDTLRRTLSERLRDHKDIRGKILKVGGAIGNTGPKIDILFMLYAFEKPVRDTLYGIAEIRNFFAHNLDASFDSEDKQMVRAMQKLCLHNGKTVYPHHIYDGDTDLTIETVSTNRDKFLVNLKLCLIMLMRDRVSHETWSNKPLTKKTMAEMKRLWKKRDREEGTGVTYAISAVATSLKQGPKKP